MSSILLFVLELGRIFSSRCGSSTVDNKSFKHVIIHISIYLHSDLNLNKSRPIYSNVNSITTFKNKHYRLLKIFLYSVFQIHCTLMGGQTHHSGIFRCLYIRMILPKF